jgi:hypothetical protein
MTHDISNKLTWIADSRALPQPISGDGQYGPARGSRYGELMVGLMTGRWRYNLADEGTYFSAHNATNDASTTLAGHAAPVLVDADATMTKPFIHLVNSDAVTSRTRVYLDYIEIEVITAGANGTADSWADQLDTGASRITTPGTALTKINGNMQSATTAVLSPTGGPIVVSAESANSRNLGFGQLRPSIQVAGDKFMFVFGGEPEVAGIAGVTATINRHVITRPPVVLGPADFYMLALYSPSQSAAGVYKVRMGWWER